MGSSWSVYVGRGEVLSLGLLPARCRWVRGACMTLLRLQAEQWCTQCTWAGRWRDKTALGNDGVSSTPSSSLGKRCAMLREEWVACFNAKTRQVGARNNQRCLCLFETQVYSSLFLFCTGLVTLSSSHTWAINKKIILLTDIPLQFPAPKFSAGALQPARKGPVFFPERAAFLIKDEVYVVIWNQRCTRMWGNGTTYINQLSILHLLLNSITLK